MLLKPAFKQLTLVQSDISPFDYASYLYLLSNISLLHVYRKCDIQQYSGLKRNLKVSTVNIQITKRSGIRVSNSKVFSSGCIKNMIKCIIKSLNAVLFESSKNNLKDFSRDENSNSTQRSWSRTLPSSLHYFT